MKSNYLNLFLFVLANILMMSIHRMAFQKMPILLLATIVIHFIILIKFPYQKLK
ncbi:MAG: hypothetical protein KBA33_10170 [Cloacibacterium sp.]|nr:hypothetical protein [Cloacibacterium sp.]